MIREPNRLSLDIRIGLLILVGLVPTSFRSLSSRTESESSDGKAEAILLVDADDAYVLAQTRSLRRLGYPYVFRARSVLEALDLLRHVCPTIVLTDAATEEGARVWSELLKCSAELGASTAVVSSDSWHGWTASDLRVFTKAELSDEVLERLIYDLVAENRAKRRESAWHLRSSAEDAALAMPAEHQKTG